MDLWHPSSLFGVLIYEFKPDAQIRKKVMSEVMHKQLKEVPIFGLHAKSMVIDDDITVIGTFNVDPRSANLNTESITNPKTKRKLKLNNGNA